MARDKTPLLALNRGIMSALGAARVDLKRTSLAAETMTNWIPRALGPMSLRPGLEYIGATYGNAVCRNIPFIYSTSSTALLELTDSLMRVRLSDALLTRASVSSAITNGTFNTDLTGWTDHDESGATSAWATGGYLSLIGSGTNRAMRTQEVTVAVGDRNVEHALRIEVTRGPVQIRVGSTAGTDDYVTERTLRTGTHSLAFTPTGNFHVRLINDRKAASLITSVAVEAAGVVTLPTPWTASSLPKIRHTQSADVLFVACEDIQQRRIEHWSDRSWSIVKYEPEDGPWRLINTSDLTLTPSALFGDITLTASRAMFKSTHVGALFKLTATGQLEIATATGADQFTDPIVVSGVGGERRISISITGTWAGSVTLQYSVGAPGAWIDVLTWTANVSRGYTDDLDGQEIYYRLGIKAGDYTSGTAYLTLSISSGTSSGVARITGYTSETVVSAAVIDNLGGLDATNDWYEGAWSDRRGWPSAVALYEGRMWWFGRGNIWASQSDAYDAFDDELEGDSGPISRSIGEGPVDSINWALPMLRLMIGTTAAELTIKSTSFDEPLTPTNFAIRPTSTQGSSMVEPVRIDTMGAYVQRCGSRVFLLGYDSAAADYVNEDATQLVPDLNEVGIVHLAVQRQPETRIHCVREDGQVAMLVFDKVENVLAWCLIETDGEVEDVAVLPGTVEDAVYYTVKRTINGSEVRYVEKWAKESECRGGTVNKQADAFYQYSGASTASISGLSHLEGESVVVWGAGADLGTYTVSGGAITLSEAVTSATIGLPYTAQYKSMKMGLSASLDIPLNVTKRIDHIGLVLINTHKAGLEYGADFDNLDGLPLMENEAVTDVDEVWESYDQGFVEFNGEWTTDARICLKAQAPRPCTVLAVQVQFAAN